MQFFQNLFQFLTPLFSSTVLSLQKKMREVHSYRKSISFKIYIATITNFRCNLNTCQFKCHEKASPNLAIKNRMWFTYNNPKKFRNLIEISFRTIP